MIMKPSKQAQEAINDMFKDCVDYEEFENEGICFNCGHMQMAEVDATNYKCEECDKEAVQGLLIVAMWV